MTASHSPPGAHDFDFLWGQWNIQHERLVSRLTSSDEWERFETEGEYWPLLGGLANVDTTRGTWRGEHFEGVSLRIFNPSTGLWSIYWVDNISFTLQPPVHGSFDAGIGEFIGDDEHDGRLVLARFRWSDITADTARWDQAFSEDEGETWETNWIMNFRRRQPESAP